MAIAEKVKAELVGLTDLLNRTSKIQTFNVSREALTMLLIAYREVPGMLRSLKGDIDTLSSTFVELATAIETCDAKDETRRKR